MLREIKEEVPFEINFRASAVENNAASCFSCSAQSNPCYGCGSGKVSKPDVEFVNGLGKKMVMPGGRGDIGIVM